MPETPPPEPAVVPPTPATWVIPPSRRSRAKIWRLARFVFLASLSAGFVITWGLLREVEARMQKRDDRMHLDFSQRLSRLERDRDTCHQSQHWVVTSVDERGVHTRLCTPEDAHSTGEPLRLRCAQAAK